MNGRTESDTIQYEDPKGKKLNQGGLTCRFRDIDADQDFVLVNTHLKVGHLDVYRSEILWVTSILDRVNSKHDCILKLTLISSYTSNATYFSLDFIMILINITPLKKEKEKNY